ncbi:sulfite exporter TauE/SafE family protein [Candidatus Bathyarchaeota archaeon]|nr:sulfite exporter TauE/SafE family protein [Candidatus Bathyarchaeota archaeon]
MSVELTYLFLIFPAFLTAIIDIVFGMGFGLTMTPILLLMGYPPHEIVPALLFSSLIGNLISPIFHHKFKNVDFSLCSKHFNMSMLIGILGIVGSFIGATVSIGISDFFLGLYIGLLIVALGLFLLLNKKLSASFSWLKLFFLGFFGSFNKGISGSGFGPIVTTGMIIMKINEKVAVSIQTFSELFVSLAGFLTFLLAGSQISWNLLLPLSIGVALSTPLAALVVHKFESKKLRTGIALATVVLGILTLLGLFWN